MRFWVTLLFGERKAVGRSRKYGLKRQRIKEWVNVTPENFIHVTEYLQDLGKNHNYITYEFTTEDRHPEGRSHGGALGSTEYRYHHEYMKWKIQPEDLRPRKPGVSPFRRMPVKFDQDFYVLALQIIKMGHPDPNWLLRMYFHFASTLTHEVSH